MRVIDVLITAAAAAAEVRTFRRNAQRRFLDQVVELGFSELFFLADNSHRHAFALDRVRNKNGFAIFARDSFAAKGDVFDC